MELKNQRKIRRLREGYAGARAGVFNDRVVIRLPDWRILRLIARSLFLGIAIISFPCLGTKLGIGSLSALNAGTATAAASPLIDDAFFLPMLFRDLKRQGLFPSGGRAVFFGDVNPRSPFLNQNKMDLINPGDKRRQASVLDHTVDFVFADGIQDTKFIDRSLNIGGIVAVRLGPMHSMGFQLMPSNYRTIYIRGFDSTIVAMRKTAEPKAVDSAGIATGRRLLAIPTTKEEALSKLEDVLLEPPRVSSKRSKKYLRRTRYLPDLTGDTLDGYPRRIYVDVGSLELGKGTSWFAKHYPTRDRDFEMIRVETAAAGAEDGMSEWLRRNVREEDYVVMKAEAEVVEEMVKSRAIVLVDELFLECKHQWRKYGGRRKELQSRRAYWECLALYGKLRDEGVAVHQWWG